jgi:hypothetical protein
MLRSDLPQNPDTNHVNQVSAPQVRHTKGMGARRTSEDQANREIFGSRWKRSKAENHPWNSEDSMDRWDMVGHHTFQIPVFSIFLYWKMFCAHWKSWLFVFRSTHCSWICANFWIHSNTKGLKRLWTFNPLHPWKANVTEQVTAIKKTTTQNPQKERKMESKRPKPMRTLSYIT